MTSDSFPRLAQAAGSLAPVLFRVALRTPLAGSGERRLFFLPGGIERRRPGVPRILKHANENTSQAFEAAGLSIFSACFGGVA